MFPMDLEEWGWAGGFAARTHATLRSLIGYAGFSNTRNEEKNCVREKRS
jgi:hypothetical protein